jgi:hypothetical protein
VEVADNHLGVVLDIAGLENGGGCQEVGRMEVQGVMMQGTYVKWSLRRCRGPSPKALDRGSTPSRNAPLNHAGPRVM